VEPLFISSEHGDGLTDLYQRIESMIPEANYDLYEDRKEKRIERFNKYKEMFMDEIVQMKKDQLDKEVDENEDYEDDMVSFLREWEKEFDRINTVEKLPEENSDFDSDNEINPLD
jgi:hypothetical protein